MTDVRLVKVIGRSMVATYTLPSADSHVRQHAAQRTGPDGIGELDPEFVRQRQQGVVVVAIVLADRCLPQQRARSCVQGVDDTHLAGGDDHGSPLTDAETGDACRSWSMKSSGTAW